MELSGISSFFGQVGRLTKIIACASGKSARKWGAAHIHVHSEIGITIHVGCTRARQVSRCVPA